jgi:hypothetical protein
VLRRDIDSQAMRNPVERLKHPRPYPPTIEVDWVPIDRPVIEAVLAGLRANAIPLAVANAPMGCDGTSFELFVGDGFCNARITWWCNLPREWQKLQRSIAELRQVFEQAWAGNKFDHAQMDRHPAS